ncbi:hypothetical protein RHGRI_025306 [Rhododendron griersonianum]|uniref:Guanosine nucleotide diphosphate dissociation inhibitor n=1 Tax=Rhododendron griersonianum TaxID=479676 RepID=A0AAV6IQZ9_9ERIC|nr:hypothetical protein RHGRI_025306 [Rhododendron griersonianum]
MDEEYDVIVLGTGLKECILSGLLSVDGLKVLHMDRNDYYGGESTSLNLIQVYVIEVVHNIFSQSELAIHHLILMMVLFIYSSGRGLEEVTSLQLIWVRVGITTWIWSQRFYLPHCVNHCCIPRTFQLVRCFEHFFVSQFMMANGTLVRVLIHTDVTKYLYFKAVDGSFVYNKGKVHKVPATDMEALKSPLMGIFEKRRARKFFIYVQDYDETDPKTHEGMDLTRVTTRELIALLAGGFSKLYSESLARFQGGSPYIYPLYGLGELPQAFARLSAVYGGTYMLNKPECKVEFNEEGQVIGVTSEGETARCKKVVRKVGRVARAIAIMNHPIPNTNDCHSVQVILPQKQLGRKSDMYLFCCSYSHNVAPKGKFIAFVSTEAETDQPEIELKPGIDLLGPVEELFFDIYDRSEPVNEPSLDNCFISASYDATTHFESTVMDVLNMYTMITGKAVDLSVDLSAASAAEE